MKSEGHRKAWYRRPLYITLMITALLVGLSLFIPFLSPFFDAFLKFWKIIWWAVLLGLFISGMIDALVPSEYISNYLAKPGRKTIFNAAIFGFVMSVCSHGVLAISMELYKKGASAASVITFLLASPWANFAITIMLVAFFGWKAFLFIFAALMIAIITGFIYQIFENRSIIESNPNAVVVPENFSIWKDVKSRWKAFQWSGENTKQVSGAVLKGSWNVSHMVLWWIIIGTLIGSALEGFVPHNIFQEYLGPTMLGLMVTLLVATIVEVCSEGSAPIAFSIYNQTGAFGNAYIFLMAGVVTDFTEIALVWGNIGKRAAILLPIVTVPQSLLVAYLFNNIL